MRILIITQMYSEPDDIGDNKPTKTVNYFAKEWVASGHEVKVFHCSSKFPLPFYFIPQSIKQAISGNTSKIIPPICSRKKICWNDEGAKVFRIPMLKTLPGQAYSDRVLWKTFNLICNTIDKEKFTPDVVIGHFANPSAKLVSMLSKRYGAKSSIVFHGDCTLRNIHKYKLVESLNGIKAVGARSVVEANQIKKDLGLTKTPFVCCSGVPNDAVVSAEKTCKKMGFVDGIKYIYVGSLIRRKHVDSVIEAFCHCRNVGDSLLIVGGGPEEDRLKELTSKIDKTGSVCFAGRIPRNEVLQRMKEAQVFTLISDDEVYGMVYIEAMLQGCLVVASRGGGFDGIILDGKNGFLCNPGDPEMLSCIYNKIALMTEEERARIGQAAIDTAMHFSEKDVADRYLTDILRNQE